MLGIIDIRDLLNTLQIHSKMLSWGEIILKLTTHYNTIIDIKRFSSTFCYSLSRKMMPHCYNIFRIMILTYFAIESRWISCAHTHNRIAINVKLNVVAPNFYEPNVSLNTCKFAYYDCIHIGHWMFTARCDVLRLCVASCSSSFLEFENELFGFYNNESLVSKDTKCIFLMWMREHFFFRRCQSKCCPPTKITHQNNRITGYVDTIEIYTVIFFWGSTTISNICLAFVYLNWFIYLFR